MGSILKDLYDGNIFPTEQSRLQMEENQRARQEKLVDCDEFVQKLKKIDPALADQFIGIMDEQLETLPSETTDAFIDGFRLGARMMIEVFEDNHHEEKGR